MTPHEPTDSELLTSFARDGSEDAFGRLVRRHLGLVYSAALRQLGGDSGAAQDVAQLVFTELARKASTLRQHGSLAGWLHTSTRFLAAKARRTEERRHLRETTAFAMNPADTDSAAWDELRPVLDDALHELPENDREAVLLRFFEKLSLSEVGSRLGVGEDAARKRVDRALDRLRDLLAARGVTSATSTVALAAILTHHANAVVPGTMSAAVIGTALKSAATVATSGWLAWFLGWPAKAVLIAGIAAIVASLAFRPESEPTQQPGSVLAQQSDESPRVQSDPTSLADGESRMEASPAVSAGQTKLLLRVVSSETHQPIPGGNIELSVFAGGTLQNSSVVSDTNGYCQFFYPLNVHRLELVSRIDGYADSRLRWAPVKGAFIPPNHTWLLEKPISISGWVVDGEDHPVPDATVSFNSHATGSSEVFPEETEPDTYPATTTDATGRWTLNRLSETALRSSRGWARHPDLGLGANADGAMHGDALLAGTFRFVLRDGFAINGQVVTKTGEPVANAQIRIGLLGVSPSRQATTAADGRFSVSKCPPGDQPVTAKVDGFAASTEWVEIGSNTPPVRLVLDGGHSLRLRIVDSTSKPIPGAQARFNAWPNPWTKSAQTHFTGRADGDGRIVWSNAPAGPLVFDISAEGFAGKSAVELRPSEAEHTIALGQLFRVIGDVWDAISGHPIGRFKAGAASSTTNGWKNTVSIGLPDGELFSGGHFEKEFATSPITVQVEAEGYRPYHSESLTADQGDVRLDIRLQPVPLQKITLLAANGRPLPKTEVWIIESNHFVRLVPGGFQLNRPDGITRIHTDAQGQFLVSLVDQIGLMAAANESGLAMSHPSELGADRTLKMQKWGRVTGTMFRGGKPDPNGVAMLRSAEDNPSLYGCVVPDFNAYRVEADRRGRFEFPKAPPGEWRMQQIKETPVPNGVSAAYLNSVLAQVPAGGSVDVRIGEGGATIHASAEQNGLLMDTSRYVLSANVWTVDALPPAELSWNVVGLSQWQAQLENRLAQKWGRQYGTQKKDALFTATDVLPGDYVFRILAVPMIDHDKRTWTPATAETPSEFRAKAAGKLPAAVGELRFTVPDPAPPEGIDLGEIRLEPVGR